MLGGLVLEKLDLLSLTIDEMEDLIDRIGEKRYRGKQVFQWVNKGIKDFENMTNLPKTLKETLQETSFITKISIEKKWISKIDGTTKYLFRLEDGNIIEAVAMKYKHGITVCISSRWDV